MIKLAIHLKLLPKIEEEEKEGERKRGQAERVEKSNEKEMGSKNNQADWKARKKGQKTFLKKFY